MNPNPGSTRAHPYSLFEGEKGPATQSDWNLESGRGEICGPSSLPLLPWNFWLSLRNLNGEGRPDPTRPSPGETFDSFRVSWREGNFFSGIGFNFIFLFSFLPIPTLFFHPGAKLGGLV